MNSQFLRALLRVVVVRVVWRRVAVLAKDGFLSPYSLGISPIRAVSRFFLLEPSRDPVFYILLAHCVIRGGRHFDTPVRRVVRRLREEQQRLKRRDETPRKMIGGERKKTAFASKRGVDTHTRTTLHGHGSRPFDSSFFSLSVQTHCSRITRLESKAKQITALALVKRLDIVFFTSKTCI